MNNNLKILLAEDEVALGQIIKESLESRNFEVLHCKNGLEVSQMFEQFKPDILVLDIMMPKKDGLTLAKEIRLKDKTTPIIFLTAKSQVKDVVKGFETGGDDYLKKPFSMEELIVRIHNLMNRVQLNQSSATILGAFTFDLTRQQLQFQSETPVNLTHREAQLLHHLVQVKNQVLDRTLVLNNLWGNDDFFSARSMDVFISKLRKKLKQDPSIQIINVRGFGYKLISD